MKSTLPFAMLLLLSTASHANAALLFSTDIDTDELVRIDSATGSVTVIGSLGFDAKDVDLITDGSRLFAIHSDFEVRVDLHRGKYRRIPGLGWHDPAKIRNSKAIQTVCSHLASGAAAYQRVP